MVALHRWHLTDIDTLSPLEDLDAFRTFLNGLQSLQIVLPSGTQQQPRHLSCTSQTTQPFTKHHTPEALFNGGSHCSRCTDIWNGLTSYIFPFIGERRTITHHVTCNSENLIYGIQCAPYQTIYRRNKSTTQRSPQQTPQTRQLTSPPTYQKISSLIFIPLMTSQSFH